MRRKYRVEADSGTGIPIVRGRYWTLQAARRAELRMNRLDPRHARWRVVVEA